MKIAGIIAEYNPFHPGHAHHIQKTKALGADRIVCVMSGNFTQRGDVAVASKWARAQMALRHGADLVVELPLTFSLASAERFARGGVALLEALGCVNAVSFGSESGDLNALRAVASFLDSGAWEEELAAFMSQGLSYAAARQQAVASHLGKAADLLSSPNDTLGIEYLRSLSALGSSMQPWVVARKGAAHDEQAIRDGFVSASYLRSLWQKGTPDWSLLSRESQEVLKEEEVEGRFPILSSGLESALLGLLRSASKEQFSALPDLSEGLENRLWKAVKEGTSLEEIHALAQTKRYPLARIRRLCLLLALGVTREDCPPLPCYLRLLGMNQKGAELLKETKLPVISGASDLKALGEAAQRQYALECHATDLYTLAYPRSIACGSDQRQRIIIF